MNRGKIQRATTQNGSSPGTVLMLLTNAYDPDPRVRQEALALIGLGFRVRLLAWDRDLKSPETEQMEGVEVERVRLASRHGRGTTQLFYYVALYLRMLWRGWKIPFTAVHCHDLDTLPLGFLLGKVKRKPVVYDAHESFLEMFEGRVHPWVLGMLMALENFLLRRVDLLITVGEKLRRYFEDRGARHTAVVGNWKDLKEFERTAEENEQVRARLGIPPEAIVVTCITQLLKNRMIEELVEAARPYSDVYVILAGKGELEPLVAKWASEDPRVIHLGFIHASVVAGYTCASDVIYCGFDPAMSNFRFAAPNKLFEALAAGKPLITPDIGEIGDLVRGANCGVVMADCSAASVREAIERMRDPALRGVWTRNAKDLGRTEMNWNKGREVLYQEYSRLVTGLKSSTGRSDSDLGTRPAGIAVQITTASSGGRTEP
jgi:glycosyltransferase involved in cell wall biosynthesis